MKKEIMPHIYAYIFASRNFYSREPFLFLELFLREKGFILTNRNTELLKKMTGIAMFSALAFIVSLVFRLPVMFLTFDAKDAVIAIAGFIYGPVSAVIISIIAALIEFISISDTGWYGLLMNFASSATFAGVASLIYKFKRNFAGSIIGLYSAVVAVAGVMMMLNVFVTPYYMGVEQDVVIEMLPKILLPFNFAKALMNASIAMLLYKPVTYSLRRARLIPPASAPTGFNKRSVITIIVGGVSLLIAATIFFILKK